MALATRPSVLLLDEPTAGLSNAETGALTELVRTFPTDLTVLIIEHDLGVIFDLTDQLTVLQNGVVIADGPSDIIREDPIVKEVYLGR
jgi:ABC-type branched-subunit amino acid transport system ATPase component